MIQLIRPVSGGATGGAVSAACPLVAAGASDAGALADGIGSGAGASGTGSAMIEGAETPACAALEEISAGVAATAGAPPAAGEALEPATDSPGAVLPVPGMAACGFRLLPIFD